MRYGLIAGFFAISALTVSCAEGAGDLGYGVTERSGAAELTVALCGAQPPTNLVVARAPSDGIQDPQQVDLADLAAEDILFEVDESGWESDLQVFELGDLSDAPSTMQRVVVYAEFDGAVSQSSGWVSMPEPPWPSHPLALTSAFDFQRSVRLDTERGDLCEPA